MMVQWNRKGWLIMNGDLVVIAKTWLQREEQFPIDFDEIWERAGYTVRFNAATAFRKCCENFGLTQGVDYSCISMNRSDGLPGKPRQSWTMTIGAAKRFLASSQTQVGFKTIDALIKAEEELNSIKAGGHVAFDPTDPKQLLGYLHDYATKLVKVMDELAVAEPKAQVYDDIMKADGNITFRETAKTLNILEPTLKNLLVTPREKGGWGLWYYLGGNAVPRAEYGESGQKLFVVVPVLANNKMRMQVKTTPKGLLYLCSLWNERVNSNQLSFGNG